MAVGVEQDISVGPNHVIAIEDQSIGFGGDGQECLEVLVFLAKIWVGLRVDRHERGLDFLKHKIFCLPCVGLDLAKEEVC